MCVSLRYMYLIALSLISFSAASSQCVYYISNLGNDNNDGLSEAKSWATISNINDLMLNSHFKPGDTICFKRGDTWHEQLTITQSGINGAPITFTSYGAGSNPLIVRSDPIGWWQHSMADGGFERFDNNVLDLSNPNFAWPWYEAVATNSSIAADPDNALVGNYAAKLTRNDSTSGYPALRMARGVLASTQYYLRFNVKTASDSVLSIRVRDDHDGAQDYYLQEDLTTWGTSPVFVKEISSSEYSSGYLVFTTRAEMNRLDIQFTLTSGVGSVWLDEVIVVEGSSEPVKKIWHGRFVDSTVGKIYGLQDKGQRVPTRDDISDPELLDDLESIHDPVGILYRRDDGNLTNIEVGRRANAIRVEAQSHVVIDGIDTRGAHARPAGVTGESFGAGLVFISPGSSSITVKNATASQSSSGALSAGVYLEPNNPSDIVYENITAFDNQSTGLYIRGSGRISNCLTYNNGTLDADTGDRGGIGLQEGPAIIEDNEIHSIGQGDRDIDSAISICCGLKGKYQIRRNYVHDVSNGALQISGTGLPLDHVVEYNIFERYGQNTTTDGVTYGKFAGIRLIDAPSTRVNNNVIAFGGSHLTANGLLLRNNVQNTVIKNNIFYHNQQSDIRGVYGLDATGWISDNNLFWRSDFADAWWWEDLKYSDLSRWRIALEQDTLSYSENPAFVESIPTSTSGYMPSFNSPLIDSGEPLQVPNSDFYGNLVIANPDIGAIEYGSNNLTQTESTVSGTSIGGYQDLMVSDGVYEILTEEYSRQRGGVSQLEHYWSFNSLANAATQTLYIQAHRSENTEGDDFIFQYRLPDDSWVDLLIISRSQASSEYQIVDIPVEDITLVEIRVVDADRTKKNTGLDTLYIDHMFIRSH